MPHRLIGPIALILGLLLGGCGSDSSGPQGPTRSYLMGFSAFPPRPDTALLLGLVDSAFAAKPALVVWDSLLALDHR